MKKKLLSILLMCLLVLGLTGCQGKIKVKDNLNFEINTELKNSDLVILEDDIKLINENDLIDTTKLGNREVIIKYLVGKKEKYETVIITVVDTQAPNIEGNDELRTIKGKEINLLEGVKVTDNSNEEIEVEVNGEYDINTVGEYKLKYIASDSSNNKAEKEFTLKVDFLIEEKIEKHISKCNRCTD